MPLPAGGPMAAGSMQPAPTPQPQLAGPPTVVMSTMSTITVPVVGAGSSALPAFSLAPSAGMPMPGAEGMPMAQGQAPGIDIATVALQKSVTVPLLGRRGVEVGVGGVEYGEMR